jgi:hypothetical protein
MAEDQPRTYCNSVPDRVADGREGDGDTRVDNREQIRAECRERFKGSGKGRAATSVAATHLAQILLQFYRDYYNHTAADQDP